MSQQFTPSRGRARANKLSRARMRGIQLSMKATFTLDIWAIAFCIGDGSLFS
jgi:hypothetical protein